MTSPLSKSWFSITQDFSRTAAAARMPPKANPESKFWCFTLNNYAVDLSQPEPLAKWITDLEEAGMTYLIYSEEKGGKKNTPHLQGYIEMRTKKRLSFMIKLPGIGGGASHFELRRGTQNEAIAYCQKTDDPTFVAGPYTHGQPAESQQGKRSDLLEIQTKLKSGKTVEEVAEENFASWTRYHKSFEKYAAMVKKPTPPPYTMDTFRLPPQGLEKPLLIYGPTGTGKTSYALAHFASPLCVRHIDDLGLLNPKQHDGIVFDDMDFKHFPATGVIHLLDYELDTAVHVRYQVARIPKGFKRIFTFNDDTPLEGPLDDKSKGRPYPSAQLEAIRRRYDKLYVDTNLFGVPESPPWISPAEANEDDDNIQNASDSL